MVLCSTSLRSAALVGAPFLVLLAGGLSLCSASRGAAQAPPEAAPALSPTPDAVLAPPLALDACPERYLVLQVEPTLSEALAREIAVDLTAELQTRGIGVCTGERAGTPPLARITLRQSESVLVIELDDRMTQKRVQRDLSLLKVPESGRALATAIAVDELLRASWAELTMGNARPAPEPAAPLPAPEPPPEPYIPPRKKSRARWGALTLAAGYGHGSASWSAVLAGMNLSAWPRHWLWLQLGLFGLRTRSVDDPLGQVHARGLVAEATLGGCPWNDRRLYACAGVRGGLDYVSFQATANRSLAEALDRGATGAHLQGVAALGFALTRHLLLSTEIALGGPLQEVVATDGERRLLGTRGPLWTFTLGLGVAR